MPNKNSPPKHKTPNYRLQPFITSPRVWDVRRNSYTRAESILAWQPMPLRQDRKDLA